MSADETENSHISDDYLLYVRSIALQMKSTVMEQSTEELHDRLRPKQDNPASRIPGATRMDQQTLNRRWKILGASEEFRRLMVDPDTLENMEEYRGNIENFIGTVKMPVGIAGPIRINGLFAQGDYYVPMATTEAALVASYCRGAQLISAVGGCTAMLLAEGIQRAPGFSFTNMMDACDFVRWSMDHIDKFKEIAESTTRHGRIADMRITIEGNHVYLIFEMFTGDASGQNMITIATSEICAYILENTPVKPEYSFVEANLSGDKKASYQSLISMRGKKVTAEVIIPESVVARHLHTTPRQMEDYWRMSALGGVLSGSVGVHGHYANGLAAIFIATGQDAACVAEAAVGVTRFQTTPQGELYASVTLPNLIVGTVGGGTGLPTQRIGLEIMGLSGAGKAKALAEVVAGVLLAGELSIIGALSAGQFARAHEKLARGRRRPVITPGPDVSEPNGEGK